MSLVLSSLESQKLIPIEKKKENIKLDLLFKINDGIFLFIFRRDEAKC